MNQITLEIPFPPSTNTYYRHVGHKVLISEKGRAYRQTVIDVVRQITGEKFGDARLSVVWQLYPPTRRRYDVDNTLKAGFDALTHAGMWLDDEQIDELHVFKQAPSKDACVLVTITKLKTTP